MSERTVLIPDASHPIGIEKTGARVIVSVATGRIADSDGAQTLTEASYPPVYYIPREDVDMSLLVRSAHTTYCPYKGEANYYSVPSLGEKGRNCIWTYEAPYEAVARIAQHLAFYPDRVDIELRDRTGSA